ncbi:MAG: DapH/DapD/GlmU-related protein [Herminiimonas sp.]|uniref:DapH/DapD/GlmU-related protein n=1 Tax=Herminiimonas sp. TaxID=1926289 RepID=UPI00272287F6|nr:DapH/DapD/GlmU-related protein [Herminiimonas sp.]MDO9419793.1 DapH/DapD/GlmU-related protein [Herminiimonas sp.]
MSDPIVKHASIVNVQFGDNVTVVQPVNLYGCKLGNGVFIGPFVEIQKTASVGARTKVQSHAFICELVTIGDDCFIGHGVMFINDTFATGGPANGNKSLWQSTSVGNRVSIGSNASILPVSICDDVVIGAGAVVVKNITEPGVYVGNPVRKIRDIE